MNSPGGENQNVISIEIPLHGLPVTTNKEKFGPLAQALVHLLEETGVYEQRGIEPSHIRPLFEVKIDD